MIVGRPRFGKSRALNEIFQMDKFVSKMSPGSQTTAVISQVLTKEKEKLIVIDTPGLSAADLSMNDVVLQMKRAVTGLRYVMIFVFAVDKAIESCDKEMINKIHSAFGNKIWHSSIILLTFCDEYKHLDKENKYKNHLKEVANELENLLKLCGADFKSIKTVFEMDLGNDKNENGEITAIPVGYNCSTSKLLPGILPKHEYWREVAFSEIMKKVPKELQQKITGFANSKSKTVIAGASVGVFAGLGGAALLGAIAGSAIGPLGMAVGAALGAMAGGGAGAMAGGGAGAKPEADETS